MSSNDSSIRYWYTDNTDGTGTWYPMNGDFVPYEWDTGTPMDGTSWTIKLSAPCPMPNSPKCPVFEKYGFPGKEVKLESPGECPHTKTYDCPYLVKMEGTELSDDNPEGDPQDPEEGGEPEPPQDPEPTPPEPEPPEESPEIELAAIRAQIAVLEADKARREENEVEILLEEAKKISPVDVDKLLEPFSTQEGKKVFLTNYLAQLKKAGFPRKEEKKKLELSNEEYQKKEDELFKDLFGDISPEELIGKEED